LSVLELAVQYLVRIYAIIVALPIVFRIVWLAVKELRKRPFFIPFQEDNNGRLHRTRGAEIV
jgi:hypothetical protein